MNHLKAIAAKLPEYGIDAMLLDSEPGEFYAVGFHGEGNVVVTPEAWPWSPGRSSITSPTPGTSKPPTTSSPGPRSL